MPTPRLVSEIKTKLLRPALTSHFEVEIGVPGGDFISKFLPANGIVWNSFQQSKIQLMCSEAVLPGSNLATLEINGDYTGVTERHAYRRIYDDRIDLTFYVDAENYLPIRLFETWIKYIVDESVQGQADKNNLGSTNTSYFYRVRYPDGDGDPNSQNNGYVSSGLKVIKFERDYQQKLEYEFIKAFPISVTSIPVSYDSSSLLKCTVSMTYIRYILKPTVSLVSSTNKVPPLNPNPAPVSDSTPQTQAEFNSENIGRVITNEYYNNFGDNRQNATNTADFFGVA